MSEKGESLKGACETLGVSRSGYYGKSGSGRTPTPLNRELVEKIKGLRVAHPFWGYC
jgi:hypothetical protein